jgi:hypothetical protein
LVVETPFEESGRTLGLDLIADSPSVGSEHGLESTKADTGMLVEEFAHDPEPPSVMEDIHEAGPGHDQGLIQQLELP